MSPSRFTVVPENRLAFEAARDAFADPRAAAARCGGVATLCGPAGSGQSTIVGMFWAKASAGPPTARRGIARTSAAKWASEFAAADRDGKPADWAERPVASKLWVVEGVEWFRGSRRTAAATRFAAAVDRVSGRGGMVLLTAASETGGLPRVGPRLSDRMAGGLVAAIMPLSSESRATLLRRFAESRGMAVSKDHASALMPALGLTAGEVQADAEAFERLVVGCGGDVTDDAVNEFVRRRSAPKPTTAAIARLVAREFSARVTDLRASGRSSGVVLPRQAAMFLARTVAGEPYKAIGQYFGNRNHSTVVHAVKRVERLLADGDERLAPLAAVRAELAG